MRQRPAAAQRQDLVPNKAGFDLSADEMHDLELQPAIPLLTATLPGPAGDAAATVLVSLGASATLS